MKKYDMYFQDKWGAFTQKWVAMLISCAAEPFQREGFVTFVTMYAVNVRHSDRKKDVLFYATS